MPDEGTVCYPAAFFFLTTHRLKLLLMFPVCSALHHLSYTLPNPMWVGISSILHF